MLVLDICADLYHRLQGPDEGIYHCINCYMLVSEGTNSSSLGCCIYHGLFHCAMQLLEAQTSAHEKGHQLQDEKGID